MLFFLKKSSYLLEIYTKVFMGKMICCLEFKKNPLGLGWGCRWSKIGCEFIIALVGGWVRGSLHCSLYFCLCLNFSTAKCYNKRIQVTHTHIHTHTHTHTHTHRAWLKHLVSNHRLQTLLWAFYIDPWITLITSREIILDGPH